jgi:uncharacterized LabA/DUF88 family protein
MQTAVLIDLAFALKRYKVVVERPSGREHSPEEIVDCLWKTAKQHADAGGGSLYRILCYDCDPYERGSTHPVTGLFVDFSRSSVAKRNRRIQELLISRRSVAMRRGRLVPRQWSMPERTLKEILSGRRRVEDLEPSDLIFDLRQKQVDMKLGLDVASLAYKRLVQRIVLVAGDSDFVPAAKLARREGLDFVLDPLWHQIDPDLREHIDGLKTFWAKPRRPPHPA